MDKRKGGKESDVNIKRRRKVITLEEKLEVIKRHEDGTSNVKIGHDLGFNESTVRTILNKKLQYKEQGKVASISLRMQSTRNRSPLMIEMERLLHLWIEDCNQKRIPLCTRNIQTKALNIFSMLKENKFNGDTETFAASLGWFNRFKHRIGLYNVRITGEAATSAQFPEIYQKIEECNYDDRQIFNVDETGLWKKMPTKTFLASHPGYQASLNTDRISLLVSENYPLQLDDEQPRAFEEPVNNGEGVAEKTGENNKAALPKEISVEELEKGFKLVEAAKDFYLNVDPNMERGVEVCKNLERAISSYRRLYNDEKKKSKSVQLTLDRYFLKKKNI